MTSAAALILGCVFSGYWLTATVIQTRNEFIDRRSRPYHIISPIAVGEGLIPALAIMFAVCTTAVSGTLLVAAIKSVRTEPEFLMSALYGVLVYVQVALGYLVLKHEYIGRALYYVSEMFREMRSATNKHIINFLINSRDFSSSKFRALWSRYTAWNKRRAEKAKYDFNKKISYIKKRYKEVIKTIPKDKIEFFTISVGKMTTLVETRLPVLVKQRTLLLKSLDDADRTIERLSKRYDPNDEFQRKQFERTKSNQSRLSAALVKIDKAVDDMSIFIDASSTQVSTTALTYDEDSINEAQESLLALETSLNQTDDLVNEIINVKSPADEASAQIAALRQRQKQS